MSKTERIYSPKNVRREEAPLLSDTVTLCENNKRSGVFVQQDYRLFLYNNQEYLLKYDLKEVSHLTAPEVLQLLLQSILRFILKLTTS